LDANNISEAKSLGTLPRKQVIITVIGVMLAMFLSSLDQTVVGTAMPRIIADLGGFSEYTWITTIYMITSAVTIPITGKIIDMYGRKTFYIAGIAIFVSFSFACGLSHSMTQIIVFRGIQGIGAGIMMANAFTVIGDIFPPAERGKYQGLISAVFGFSSVIGPTLGGFLTQSISWHWVFFVNMPLGLAIIFLFMKFFPDIKPDIQKHYLDYWGVAALILAVVPTMLALSWGGVDYPWASPEIIGAFVFSGAMLVVFIMIERRAKEPVLPLTLFRNRIVSVSEIVIFLTGIGMFGGIVFVPLFFQGILGATPTSSGNMMIPMSLAVMVGSFLSGQFLARAGGHYRIQGLIGIGILAIGILLLSRLTVNTSYATIIVYIIITGFGSGITMPLYTIAVQNVVPYSVLGVATSSTAFFRSFGSAVGLSVLGSVMNNRLASELVREIPADVKAIVPADELASIVDNPQALVNPDIQAQLKAALSQMGTGGSDLYNQIVGGLRDGLASSIAHVFLISFIIILLAFIANIFLKEIPLRKKHAAASERSRQTMED
jgi:EmrB/QacA subfamily drug resistance transporter